MKVSECCDFGGSSISSSTFGTSNKLLTKSAFCVPRTRTASFHRNSPISKERNSPSVTDPVVHEILWLFGPGHSISFFGAFTRRLTQPAPGHATANSFNTGGCRVIYINVQRAGPGSNDLFYSDFKPPDLSNGAFGDCNEIGVKYARVGGLQEAGKCGCGWDGRTEYTWSPYIRRVPDDLSSSPLPRQAPGALCGGGGLGDGCGWLLLDPPTAVVNLEW